MPPEVETDCCICNQVTFTTNYECSMKVLYKDNAAHVILNDEDNYPLIQFFDVNFGVTLFPYMLILILVYCIS